MRESLEAAAQALVRLVMENREKYLQAWVAETGLPPSECELVFIEVARMAGATHREVFDAFRCVVPDLELREFDALAEVSEP